MLASALTTQAILGISGDFDEALGGFGWLWQSLGRLCRGFESLWGDFGEALGDFGQALGVSGEALARLLEGIEDTFGSFGEASWAFGCFPKRSHVNFKNQMGTKMA